MLKIPAPRLLPATIATMSALLAVKFGMLVLTAVTHGPRPDGAMVAAAYAASTEATKEHAKPGASTEAAKEHAKPGAGNAPSPTEQKTAAPVPAPIPEGPPPVSDSEKALLQELRQRRQELDARADAAATRESLLVATEKKLAARVNELQALQKTLEGLDAAQKQKEDTGWQGLVKLYEVMKPKDAATIFNDLSMPVLLQVLDRMKDAKAAAIMAAMTPDKARDVTAELAQMRTGRDAAHASPAASRPASAGG
jgi:flagellar motility protein MotE (MotC chaperone)